MYSISLGRSLAQETTDAERATAKGQRQVLVSSPSSRFSWSITGLAGRLQFRAMTQPEYVSDVPYARHFVQQTAPQVLRLVAALHGIPAPPGDDFELLRPRRRRGRHAAHARRGKPGGALRGRRRDAPPRGIRRDLAAKGSVENARFLERDFEDLAKDDLPAFDFIVLHGIFTWVGPTKRAAAITFAKSKLKPGGLLYVSYNALPGWAAITPLRRLLRDHAEAATGTTLERAGKAYDFVRKMSGAGASDFTSHPTAKSMLGLIEEAGLPYVVHEYLNPHWQPFYFADIARELGEQDLHFVGQIPLAANLRELALPPALKELAKPITDRIAYETFKDFALNEAFRSDVYVKGTPARTESAAREVFERTPFGTLSAPAQMKREVRLSFHTLSYTGPVYDAVLGAIGEAPASAAELAERPKLLPFGAHRIADCLQNLALGGQVVPMRRGSASTKAGRGYELSAYNRVVLAQGIAGSGPRAFASPAAGTGVALSLLEAICLQLVTAVPEGERAAWIQAFARERLPLTLGGKSIKSADALERLIARELEGFTKTSAPKLAELGILSARE